MTHQTVLGSQWIGGSEQTGPVFRVMIAKARTEGAGQAFVDYVWDAMHIGERMIDVRQLQRGDRKHMTVFLSRGRTWIIVVVSKVDFRPDDAAAFEAVLKSIRIDGPGPAPQ